MSCSQHHECGLPIGRPHSGCWLIINKLILLLINLVLFIHTCYVYLINYIWYLYFCSHCRVKSVLHLFPFLFVLGTHPFGWVVIGWVGWVGCFYQPFLPHCQPKVYFAVLCLFPVRPSHFLFIMSICYPGTSQYSLPTSTWVPWLVAVHPWVLFCWIATLPASNKCHILSRYSPSRIRTRVKPCDDH